MRYTYFNPNPKNARVGDCVIRAISCVTNKDWIEAYIDLCCYGIMLCDLPSANIVWGRYLHDKGFIKRIIPDICPDCYTVRRFAEEHEQGIYVLALNGHVVCVKDGGRYFDTWDSGDEVVLYYWEKE